MAAASTTTSDRPLVTTEDGISQVVFGRGSMQPMLAVSSWDTTLRLMHNNGSVRQRFQCDSPVLDCEFGTEGRLYSSCLSGVVMSFDPISQQGGAIGKHRAGARCINFCPSEGIVLSGGWDQMVLFWDERARHANVASTEVAGKVYSMSVSQHLAIVATSGRHIYVWDLRNTAHPMQRRESSLKHQTRCVRAFPNGEGFALSSIEGRVAIEYIDPSPEVQAKKYAFKCHRRQINGVDTVYPVNALAFHPSLGTFASGGCDGVVNMWDGDNKKRLCVLPRYPSSIASLSFSEDGSMLAVASSYTFEEGVKDHEPDTVFLHQTTEAEVTPKARR